MLLLCSECKWTQLGREYMGRLSTTLSGKTCQEWTSNSPHTPNAAASQDANFPDGSRAAAKNYCRNPDSYSDGVWCYTTDPNMRYEKCDVPLCPGNCTLWDTFLQWRRQDLLLEICHGALTVDFRAGCSSCSMTNSFVTNAVLIERAVSCWHLHKLISHTTQYVDSWLSDLLQRELKMQLLEVEGGARAPVPHSWRRHCFSVSNLSIIS